MRHKIMAVALVVMMGVALAGCQTQSGYYDPGASAAGGMLGGAATGAALGAIIGAATGNPGTGAWIGAASGAGVGALGGSIYAREQNLARAQAAPGPPSPGYDPGMGNVVAIDQATVDPPRVQPGGQMMLTMNYRVMTPQNQPVSVQLVREISKDGQMIDQPYQEPRQVQNGSHAARVAYNLPASVPPGSYVATFRIVSSLGSTEKSVPFYVQ
jgi:hypothetical protein